MADLGQGSDQQHPNLNLSPDERQLFGRVFAAADTDNIGVVTGDVALKFFPERTKLPSEILGEIWQIADTEDKGFLIPAGFNIILRLIGYAQIGQKVNGALALKPGGPLPRFQGINAPTNVPTNTAPGPLQPQSSGGPIRVPPLAPDRANQYAALFDESGAQNGLLSGLTAKQIFDRAQLPNDVLVRIWNLADTEMRGSLNITEFIIAMHLLASYKGGTMRTLPQILPPGLYEAAIRRGVPPPRGAPGSRPTSDVPPISNIPRQFSGAAPQRTSSPLAGPPYRGSPVSTMPAGAQVPSGGDWAIVFPEKAQYEGIFANVDKENRGFVTGDQAVEIFSKSKLPEDDLAQIWDLADINSSGQLSRDEFAVAMHLIRQQIAKKGPLPTTLPSNLIPPSMRRQPIPTPQSTAPTFDNTTNMAKPKSAVDDLFGLDAISTPEPQIPQSTGGSTAFAPMPSQPTGQSPPHPTQQSSVFKPFVPSSSFGQNMMTPQATGSVNHPGMPALNRGLQQQQQPSVHDDLLGDTDPEISKRLTQETTELANLSNQVGNLTTQMQQVKSKRVSTEQDLSQVNTQKREFENRLLQLRSAYEQEARDVKALEDRLTTSKNETKKLQQDLAMVQHSYQNLQEQHQQISAALDADQKENANLKERMRGVNNEIAQLKPTIEKMRSDARQQRGLVAINKKQLSTIEAELEKLKTDLAGASEEHQDATREVEDSKREVDEAQHNLSNSPPAPAPAIASPTPSTSSQSMNPFFRRAATATSERGMSRSPFTPQTASSPNHDAFDSFFGPSLGTPATQGTPSSLPAPPSTSFNAATPSSGGETFRSNMAEPLSVRSLSIDEAPMIPGQMPPSGAIPPPLSQSRQISSSVLPFRENLQRSDSNSSVGVAPPSSRFGDDSGVATPKLEPQKPLSTSPTDIPQEKGSSYDTGVGRAPAASSHPIVEPSPSTSKDVITSHPNLIGAAEVNNGLREFGQPNAPAGIPGSFPVETPPFHTPLSSAMDTGESVKESGLPADNHFSLFGDPSNPSSNTRNAPTTSDDFDSAFLGSGNTVVTSKASDEEVPSRPFGNAVQIATRSSEFPPIQELGADDDSDSDYSDHGFEDNFTTTSPKRPNAEPMEDKGKGVASSLQNNGTNFSASAPVRPSTERTPSNTSQLPTPNAQKPPPTYDQTVSPGGAAGVHRDSNLFPAEYGGLLPSREDPTSSPPISHSPETTVRSPVAEETGSSILGNASARDRALSGSSLLPSQMPMLPGATAAPYAYETPQVQSQAPPSQQQPQIPPKNAFDEFDHEFGDLSEAQAADDKGDDDFSSSHREGLDEFNPVFDSPAASKIGSSFYDVNNSNSAFHDFESSISGMSQSTASRDVTQAPPAANHDWDAMFANFDGVNSVPEANGTSNNNIPEPIIPPKEFLSNDAPKATLSSTATPSKPPLGRALTSGTEHDDPILKRLTGMGYPRDESLSALEKFDYNLDKAADYLTSKA